MRNTALPPLLPIAPRPFASELISSWLARTACRYDLSLAALARHFGGETRLSQISAPALDYDPPAPLIDAVASAVRLSVTEIRELALKAIWPHRPWHRFAWAYVGPDPVSGRLFHTRQLAVAWCPLCLRDDRQNTGAMYLRRQWALATCGYCHRHHFPLQDICPGCQAPNPLCFVAASRTTLLVCRSCGSALDRTPDPSRTDPVNCRTWQAASIFEQNFDRAVDGWMPDQFAFNNTSARALVVAIDRALQTLARAEHEEVTSAFAITVHRYQRFPLAGARPATRRRLLAATRAFLWRKQPAVSPSSAKRGADAAKRPGIVNR
ncbi:TniQ family protein [Sphingomonas sp. HH69]